MKFYFEDDGPKGGWLLLALVGLVVAGAVALAHLR